MNDSATYASLRPLDPSMTIQKRRLLYGALVIALLLGIGGYCGFRWEIDRHRNLRNRISDLQQKNSALTEYATGTRYSIASVRDDLERTKAGFGRVKSLTAAVRTTVSRLVSTDTDGNFEIDLATIEASDATHELETGLQDLGRRLSEFDEGLRKWEKTATSPPLGSRATEVLLEEKKEQTVYVTRTGSKYHRSGCGYLKQSSSPLKKNNAIDRGYTACSRCRP